jgi:hypothetical protein
MVKKRQCLGGKLLGMRLKRNPRLSTCLWTGSIPSALSTILGSTRDTQSRVMLPRKFPGEHRTNSIPDVFAIAEKLVS